MTTPNIPFTQALSDAITDPINGYLVVRHDGTFEAIPIESDRFRVIAEGAWRRVIASGANLYRTAPAPLLSGAQYCRVEHVGDSYLLSNLKYRSSVLLWDLKEHTAYALDARLLEEARLVEEARKADEVAA